MNTTIAWIMAAFVIATIITDLSAFILMKNNKRAYKRNGNNPRKGKAYYAYLVISRLAIAMTIVAGAIIMFVGLTPLCHLMTQHTTAAIYIATACLCLTIARGTWCATKRDIREEQQRYDVIQNDNPLETFIDPKDLIAVNETSLWLIANIIIDSLIIAFVVNLNAFIST